MKEQQKKKNKFYAFLTSLCSPRLVPDVDQSKNKKKLKLKVNKTPRLTFYLDRVLVKVSRKNIAEEQFMEHEVLTYHLEKYIANRLKQCDIVVLSGEFSTLLTQKIPFSIQIKKTPEQAYESSGNYVLSDSNKKIQLNFSAIDAMVFQLYFGENQQSVKQSQSSGKTEKTMQENQIVSDLDKIEQILRFYHKKLKSFIFICHKDLRLEDIHSLFLVFKENYLFEFQRVKKIQKLVCNIIYVSNDPKFLKIDNHSFSEFLMDQFNKMRAFQNNSQFMFRNKQKSQENVKKPHERGMKISQLRKTIQTETFCSEIQGIKTFEQLIAKMLEKNLHIHVSQALGTILDCFDKRPNKINWFLQMIQQRCPSIKDLTQNYLNIKEKNLKEEYKFGHDFTPIFQIKPLQSKNYSKMTALFKTHDSKDQDDFILADQKGLQDLQF